MAARGADAGALVLLDRVRDVRAVGALRVDCGQPMIRAALREAIYAGEVVFETPRPRDIGGQYDIRNWRWRAGKVEQLQGALAREVLRRADAADEAGDYAAGSRAVGRVADALLDGCVAKAFDEQLIRDCSENYARRCEALPMLSQREEFARSMRVEPPPGKSLSDRYEGRAKRLADPLWWRRQLRRSWTRRAEGGLRDLGIVRRGREPYASDLTVRHRAAQKRRWRDFMERTELVNEAGEQLPLLQVAESSLANPRLRRGEFMCRVRGFEEIAADLGHVAEFVTLTAPSAFHAQLAAGGPNPAYNGATPRDAQRWLCKMWARARAAIKRRASMLVYGFRIAEPHHDGTPHWHALLFCRQVDAEELRLILKATWLREFSAEPGAGQYRVKFERIDSNKGSAVGYVAKYVSKNIDGAGAIGAAEDGETGAELSASVPRVDAWAAVHGIRQFQQIGGPPVGLWREARRLRVPAQDADIENARAAADRGDWRGFTRNVGGIHCGRRTNIRLETAESGERNRYSEPRAARVIGLRCASAVELTRLHRWTIQRKSGEASGAASSQSVHDAVGRRSSGAPCSSVFSPLGPVAITVRAEPAPGYEWIATVPYLPRLKWSNPKETSRAGPI